MMALMKTQQENMEDKIKEIVGKEIRAAVIRPSVIQNETQNRDIERKAPSYKDIIMNGRPKEAENTEQTEDTPEKSRKTNTSMLTAEITRHHSEGGAQATDMTQHQEDREYINPEAEHDNDGERPWTTVRPRWNRNRPTTRVIGTRQNEDSLQAAERTAWLYVGHLKTETNTETVKNYLRKNSIEGELDCEELPGKGTNKAFRVGVPFKDLDRINSPDFWPSGVMIRRFRWFRGFHRNDGAPTRNGGSLE
jgi:hypothetical protein